MLIGAMGSTKRRALLERLTSEGFRFDSIIHPNVICSKWAQIDEGCIIMPGAILSCQVKLNRHVIINCGATISHDVTIGSFSTVSPGVKIMGLANVGEEVFLGVNSTVADRVTIGDGSIVAAGAVVVEDVPEKALVAGVPAVVKKIYRTKEEKPW
jgi:sugar O-acyltransferase (sialic acid O-acetyltransferase NeuD family)